MSQIAHPLSSAAISRPNHNALCWNQSSISYAGLVHLITLMSKELSNVFNMLPLTDYKSGESNEQSNAKIALIGPYDARWICVAWALIELDFQVCPISLKATSSERESRVSKCSYQIVILDDSCEVTRCVSYSNLNQDSITIPWMSLKELEGYEPSKSEPIQTLKSLVWQRPLFALHTSGTTNKPKEISLTTEALVMSGFASAIRLGLAPEDRWLCCLPFHHVGGLSIITRCALYQTTVVISEANPNELAHAISEDTVSLASLTPSLLDMILDHMERKMIQPNRGIRAILVGGAPTQQATWERAIKYGMPIRLTWGMSEACSQICTQLHAEPPNMMIPPLPFISVELDNPSNHQGALHEGQFKITGPMVVNQSYLTNDLGQIDHRGWVKVTGRADDVFISGGINIHPAEIESRLLEHPSITDAAVIACDDSKWGQRPVAIIVPQKGDQLPNDSQLIDWCKESLSKYKIPKKFCWVTALPRDALGKLKRREIQFEDLREREGER